MSEQSGQSEPTDRPPRSGSSRGDRRRPSDPSQDLLGDLQRWLIRSSAKNMRREFEDQVRRTLGGQRQDQGDVWDVATSEIPPDVGEAPECQWCPICRAARRMRDSGPGLSGPLSGAGEAVSTVVQDAISALDSLLARTGGRSASAGGPGQAGARAASERGGADPAGAEPGQATQSKAVEPKAAEPEAAEPEAAEPEPAEPEAAEPEAAEPAAPAHPPDSLAGEHGQVGWKPGDRLATTGPASDPWATATDFDPAVDGTDAGGAADRSDGRGHGPGDRS
jgi:hypothetical protein